MYTPQYALQYTLSQLRHLLRYQLCDPTNFFGTYKVLSNTNSRKDYWLQAQYACNKFMEGRSMTSTQMTDLVRTGSDDHAAYTIGELEFELSHATYPYRSKHSNGARIDVYARLKAQGAWGETAALPLGAEPHNEYMVASKHRPGPRGV